MSRGSKEEGGSPMRALRLLSIVLTLTTAMAVPLSVPAQATFPGTNGVLVFASVGTTNCPNLFIIKADGTGKKQITNCPEVAVDPTWNAAGTKIAYASTTTEAPQGGPGPLDIFTTNSDGSGTFNVTHDSVEDDDPSWNDTGTTIVEGRNRN